MKTVALFASLALLPLSAAYAAPPKPAASSLAVTYRTLKRNKPKQYEISVKYPVFAGTSPVVRLANTTLRAYAEKEVANFVRDSEKDWKEYGPDNSPGNYSLEITPNVSLARPDLISVYFDYYTYMGGAHPNSDSPAMNFGIKNGRAKLLDLRDLFQTGFNPYGGLDSYLMPQLRKDKASRVTDGELKTLGKSELSNWVVTPKGLSFQFAPYVVASYAEGPFAATVRFASIKSRLNPQGPLRPLL